MNELISLSSAEINGATIETVNARDLHAFLEVGKDFSNWMKDRISQYGFAENLDFVVFAEIGENPQGGRPAKEYAITLDMAKELSMVERNEKGKQARQYFIECERQAKQPPALNDPSALRGLLIGYTEKVIALEAKVEEDQPKVDFHDNFVNADGLYGLQNAARALACRPNLFIRHLKAEYLFYQGSALVPRVRFIQMGVFEVKNTIIDDKVRPQTYITPKGLKYLADRVPDGIKVSSAA